MLIKGQYNNAEIHYLTCNRIISCIAVKTVCMEVVEDSLVRF